MVSINKWVLLSGLCAAFSLLMISCTKKTGSDMEEFSNGKRMLALGDSYTIGEGVPQQAQFAQQAVTQLASQNIIFNKPKVIATTGWTTADLLRALAAEKPANNYDFVTLLIGVNNQFRNLNITTYRQEFTSLLTKAIAHAGGRPGRVAVLSIPDYSVTPFAANLDTIKIEREINEYNAINRSIAQAQGVIYIDITPISREARNNGSLTASDGLHPSELQYSRWATLLAAKIKEAL